MPVKDLDEVLELRVRDPEAIERAALERQRRPWLPAGSNSLMIIAADHPARGALRAGDRRLAMADRRDLIGRLRIALERPGVDGILGTADIIEDLLLLGALEDRVVIGSMNRGGLAGTVFEIDDRFTGYRADAIVRMGLDAGKMLLRIDPEDPNTAPTLESCAHAVDELAAAGLPAVVEPFLSHRMEGHVRNDLSAEAMIRVISVASGLGGTSAYTWLKVPVVPDMERVMQASTLPALLLGGEVSERPDETFEQWQQALTLPTVRGLVVGRSLLYPADDDVLTAVDTAVSLLPRGN
ncbi:hypothetical protein GCM10009765_67410 [Fodinicola feengrottensis]|uniref:Cgl0159-like domain-containing protein n=1 Tax=Fodinicola feengrottensis TaxID=435914 RepID=A0ABP4UNS2_9ACTN